ncbi:MAG TPA: serine/threonine-protein kinase [Pirellulales bacterium]
MTDSSPELADAPPEADLTGRRLGGFRLLRRIGRGAMAEVYLADQASLGRQVAVKVLKSQRAGDESYVRRFHNEARAAASLVHANIVQIYEVGSADGIHYIAQEYVAGKNLQEAMTRSGPTGLTQAVDILRQVAAALAKASAAGIVHRDIKPENIMLAHTGEVKVADFGLARVTDGDGSLNVTRVGMTMGTPLYMSPEQIEGRPLDPRSDIYSLGVTCYQMLAGAVPFRGETALSVAMQHVRSQPARLEQLRPDLPPALCRIVHRMLAKDPADRYANARDILTDLRHMGLSGTGDGHSGHDELLPAGASGDWAASERLAMAMRTAARAARRRRRQRTGWLLAGAAAMLLGGWCGWITRAPFLLEGADLPTVTRQSSPQEQLYFAKATGSEAWLKSVARFFPEAEYEIRLAEEELARRYLYQGRWDEAQRLFDVFAGADDLDRRAFGLAGQSIVLARRGEFQRSAQLLAELWPMRERLDWHMLRLLRATLQADWRASQRQAGQQEDETVQRWLDEEFGLDDSGDG